MMRESGQCPSKSLKEIFLTRTVARWAQEEVAPKVVEMVRRSNLHAPHTDIKDEIEKIDPAIIKGLFEHGVCNL